MLHLPPGPPRGYFTLVDPSGVKWTQDSGSFDPDGSQQAQLVKQAILPRVHGLALRTTVAARYGFHKEVSRMKSSLKVKLSAWRISHGRLRTRDRLVCFMPDLSTNCCLCGAKGETLDHLFVGCSYSQEVWMVIARRVGSSISLRVEVCCLLLEWERPWPLKLDRVVWWLVLHATLWALPVRVNALRCLGDLIPTLDKQAALDILQILQRCTAVDHSAPTLMCTLGVANSILKQYGIEFAAEHVLPLLCPLLIAQQLNIQQFAKYMFFVKDILRKIEEKRGVSVTDSGNSEVKVISSVNDGIVSDALQKINGAVPSAKVSSSWDEDWGPVTKGAVSTSQPSNMKVPLNQATPAPQSTAMGRPSQSSVPVHGQQAALSCAPVDIEWPPQNSSIGIGSLIGDSSKQNQSNEVSSDGNFDDLDPFANWPLRTSSGSGTSIAAKGLQSHGGSLLNTSGLGLQSNSNSVGQPKQYQADSILNISSPNFGTLPIGSNGSSHQLTRGLGAGNSTLGSGAGVYGMAGSTMYQPNDRKNIGSIFMSSNNEHPTPRIAPPPLTAAGRGRGRNQGRLGPPPSSRSDKDDK
ncbi:hypothetical protein Taro_042355 [Colocasia esculenta]|uniref:Reverse transcriptase zinc-binding domain-containing protein n=1 Tax=Colocasia esculenta TaxID=4460 RepID=A0A843WZE1_COLES|nr:hypothetical protein [Colocasia esculenta]